MSRNNKTGCFLHRNWAIYMLFGCLFLGNMPVLAHGPVITKSKIASSAEGQQNIVKVWFNNYDQIRRQAQLSPGERQKADQIMSRGLSIFMPGADKALAQNLLTELVNRYDVAAQQMAKLQIIPATEQLHRAYYQYFVQARGLFADYLKLQDDLLATDPNTGQPVASGLVERKENLAMLDQNNKMLDERLRQQFGIPPYQYVLRSQ